jgi:hypothetical protein
VKRGDYDCERSLDCSSHWMGGCLKEIFLGNSTVEVG